MLTNRNALFDRKEMSFDELTAKNSPDGRPDPTEALVTQRKKVLYRQEPTISLSRTTDWTVRSYNNIFKDSVTASAFNNYDTNAYVRISYIFSIIVYVEYWIAF